MELMKKISERHGYILSEDMEELLKLGSTMKIVIKTYCGNRVRVSVLQYFEDDSLHAWLNEYDGIREVFFDAYQCGIIDNAIKNNEPIEDLVKALS